MFATIRNSVLALTGAAVLFGAAALGSPNAASAAEPGHPGTLVLWDADSGAAWWLDEDSGKIYRGWIEDHGEWGEIVVYWLYYDPGNPSPESPSSGEDDLGTRIALLKQRGGAGEVPVDDSKTVLGKELLSRGAGLVPVWNPGDVMNESYDGAGGVGGFPGFDPNGGSFSSQLKNASKHGSSSDDDHGDDPDRPEDGGFWGDDMPGPPDLVNPNPVALR